MMGLDHPDEAVCYLLIMFTHQLGQRGDIIGLTCHHQYLGPLVTHLYLPVMTIRHQFPYLLQDDMF